VYDRSILQAIKCHTTGRERMTVLDKILFLADSIEPARTYEGVGEMRLMAQKDLDRAVLMNFDRSITYIVKKGFFLHPQTVAARNWMLKSIITEEKQDGR
ncbi:MAG: bis(5'-nucleosyl)-tetraphosphatase (symmetrical) YqeK, partial [Clostridia bacterium]|nr:bis(5'-nucleosyl)-tetraphosphatase (symmetrical) YqeK [Clostridia bacterium]